MGLQHPPFEQILAKLLAELGEFDVETRSATSKGGYDCRVIGPTGKTLVLHTKSYQRITPAAAESVFREMKRQSEDSGSEPVLFASVVSHRTDEIARDYGISWIDFAGNCRLVFPEYSIYVRRSGIRNPFGKTMSGKLNVFSTKSSRVVRAMLHEPSRGWRLGDLANDPDVRISSGLMSRIKKSMLEDGYALMHEGHLHLKRPKSLLQDWVTHCRSDMPNEYAFYVRGEVEEVEAKVASWCVEQNIEHALSKFSAAWRLTPEVRYSVATFLVSAEAIRDESLVSLREQCGAKRVDSGANLILQISEDESHFSGRVSEPLQTTSPLQTYLDLMSMGGRGEEAANAVYDKYFRSSFDQAEADAKAFT